ncbi:glycosyltransferase [Candidatus Bipolaricaulota bacterium]
MPEVIEDGITGFLVTPGDADELSDKLALLAQYRNLRKTMGGQGYERVRRLFTLEKQASAIGRILNEVCSGEGIQ